jgi:hypothetical protein
MDAPIEKPNINPATKKLMPKELTDIGDFFKTSFGRIFCSAKNQALRGSAL